jgi:hypothetical protein
MLPNTSVIGAFSMRMRVGSLIERMASTETPSLASTSCRAWAGAARITAATVAIADNACPMRAVAAVSWLDYLLIYLLA